MLPSAHLLVVEDDREIRSLVARTLGAEGWRVSQAADGREMDVLLNTSRVDLVLLDVMLPGEDGLSLCRRLRANSAIPILIVSARGDDVDRVVGLEIGADDYLPKPFNARELVARVRALLRRSALSACEPSVRGKRLTFSGWTMDTRHRTLTNADGSLVMLTPAEFDLLQVLVERAGRVLSREQLIDLTQGRTATPNERSVDILISRLRRKMEGDGSQPKLIRTVRSGGYEFVGDPVEVREG
ncbi:two-component system OmpR family response regulator [Breoghania corrubedonensis]|uniref:Regulatory protein VirG n=1 Tax=Breoghania corrubedonensis TaxID=665038 RepID=A0A2T5VCR2_9HYPH|nr:response regulator [Breoghania corrubedonensis]PTW61524.1 two-component system OmpR family response regulator [Breoghania corrubedonensis]